MARGGPRYGVERLQEKFDALTAPQRKRTLTILAVSLLALLLTQVGLYGSMIRDLHFRAKRLAIEQALGASGRQLLVPFLAKRVGELGLSAAAGCLLALSVVRCWPMGIGTLERADYWGAGGWRWLCWRAARSLARQRSGRFCAGSRGDLAKQPVDYAAGRQNEAE